MSDEKIIRVLIVDDHQIIRDGVKALLNKAEGIKIVKEASNGVEALNILKADSSTLDVVLMDIGMPEMDGIAATKKITDEFPEIKVLALSMHDDESHIINMLQNGASGYVLKTIGKQELISAIKRVATGQSYFTNEASAVLLGYLSRKEHSNRGAASNKLTKREIEIISLIANEYTNNQIAEKLYISPRTVDTHRRNLLQKLNAKNTAGLVKYAINHHLK
jgi:DNA-binding NarL/FixJ family response regulator